MKMLEICLKLVGCKSKKGLSSSSSCYLEGKNLRNGSRGFVWSIRGVVLGLILRERQRWSEKEMML